MEGKETEKRQSWRTLWYDVTQNTTFHGVRFITQKRSYNLRRVIWGLLVLISFGFFVYFMVIKLLHLIDKPKAVNVEVIYASQLEYPTITICNHNFFRGSETFRQGLYDQVYDRFSQRQLLVNKDGCDGDGFSLLAGQYFSLVPWAVHWDILLQGHTGYFASYHKVTLRVCRHVCVSYHAALCNSFIYILANQTCYISSLTPNMTITEYNNRYTHMHDNPGVDTYIRQRCPAPFTCDFESSSCVFYQDGHSDHPWIRRSGNQGAPGFAPARDHTNVYGHYLLVQSSTLAVAVSPTYTSHYLEASDEPLCVRFAYSLKPSSDDKYGTETLALYMRSPVSSRQWIWSTIEATVNEWDIALIYLGTGLFQIEFEANPAMKDLGYIAIDDILIHSCSHFNRGCQSTLMGTDYTGNISTSTNGSQCMQWTAGSFTKSSFPDQYTNHSHCRNPDKDPAGPWCYVQSSISKYKEYCDIPICQCSSEEYKCPDGVCLHPLMVCDGVADCADESDETEAGCAISTTCDFEGVNSCGYGLDPWGLVKRGKTTWQRHKGRIRNGNLNVDMTYGTGQGHYLYFDSGGIILLPKERVPFNSPMVVNSSTSPWCLSFYLYNRRDAIYPNSMGQLMLYITYGRYQRLPLILYEGSFNSGWEEHKLVLPPMDRTYNITFEAIMGDYFYSDMAIDDVKISPRNECGAFLTLPCQGLPDLVCACPGQTLLSCPQPPALACDFKDTFAKCGYMDDSNPAGGRIWSGEIAYRSTYSNGPLRSEFSIGVSGASMSPDSIKRLVSAIVTVTSDTCVTVNYLLSKRNNWHCIMRVYQESAHERQLLKTVGGTEYMLPDNDPRIWRTVYTTLEAGQYTQLAFEAMCMQSGDVLQVKVTNITTTDSTCEQLFSEGDVFCNFKDNGNCSYLDISTEGSVWLPTDNGLVVGLSERAGKPSTQSLLLSPVFTLQQPSCVMFTGVGLVREYTPEVSIQDYYNRSIVYFSTAIIPGQGFSIHVNLPPGTHRLLVVADLQEASAITLETVSPCAGLVIRSLSPRYPPPVAERGAGSLTPDQDDPMKYPDKGEDTVSQIAPLLDLSKYYKLTGHQASDMIYGCWWGGDACTLANFTSTITDYGFCHTFNAVGQPTIYTASPGSSSGLRLLLNIEQYDYMVGPQQEAGIKAFVYDSAEVAMIRDLGFSAGPGQHALVAITQSNSQSLSAPWGTCGEKELQYVEDYTASACLRECETENMLKACGCRDAYMPGYSTDDPPICNLTQYLDCVVSEAIKFGSLAYTCNCSDPCERKIYDTQISYAELSSISVDSILSSKVHLLNESHLAALEVNQRADPAVLTRDLQYMHDIKQAYKKLLESTFLQAWSPQRSVFKSVDAAMGTLLQMVKFDYSRFTDNTLDKYMSEYNLLYGPVSATIVEYSNKLLQQLEILLRSLDSYGEGTAEYELLQVVDQLQNSGKVYLDALENFKKSFSQSLSMYNANFFGKQIPTIGTLPPVQNIETVNQDCDGTFQAIRPLIDRELDGILISMRQDLMAGTQTFNVTGGPPGVVLTATALFSAKQYLSDVNELHSKLRSSIPALKSCFNEYYEFLVSMQDRKIQSMNKIEQAMEGLPLREIQSTVNDVLDYYDESDPLTEHRNLVEEMLKSYSQGKVSKQQIMQEFSEERLSTARQRLSLYQAHIISQLIEPAKSRMNQIKSLAINIYSELLRDQIKLMKYFPYNEAAARNFELWKRPRVSVAYPRSYTKAEDVYTLGDLDKLVSVYMYKVLSSLLDWFNQPIFASLNKFEEDLNSYISDVESALKMIEEEAAAFSAKTKLGHEFVRKNFLAIDIFYAQLKYQNTEQIKAYDTGAFFGDIGGFMGLLLGGSIISLFEFVDLIVFNCYSKWRRSREKSRNSLRYNGGEKTPTPNTDFKRPGLKFTKSV